MNYVIYFTVPDWDRETCSTEERTIIEAASKFLAVEKFHTETPGAYINEIVESK